MRIIISPAKQMHRLDEALDWQDLPSLIDRAQEVLDWLRLLSYPEAKALWGTNDKLTLQNYELLGEVDLREGLTPAILAYDGIAYKYMAPSVFEAGQFDYVQEHLRIISGFYGILRPLDGVVPYRLEMQAKAHVGGTRDLYEYWGGALYDELLRDDGSRTVVNLASKEYSKAVESHLQPSDKFLTCTFAEEQSGKLVQKGVYCKMARGEMVRYMAERGIEELEELKGFDRLGYAFAPELSSEDEYVFLGQPKRKRPR
ncbi:MAG: peroxide stress protein YaaA [bacterium]|nr:peroxide stress protein YaaA [bacterium]